MTQLGWSFPHNGDAQLARRILERLVELGWNYVNPALSINSVERRLVETLKNNRFSVITYSNLKIHYGSGSDLNNFPAGDLNKLFYSNEYHVNPLKAKENQMQQVPYTGFKVGGNLNLSKLVEERLIKLGWNRKTNNAESAANYHNGYLTINYGGNYNGIGWSLGLNHFEIGSLDKLFNSDEYKYVAPKPTFKEVKLNGEYTAKVYKDKVVVGCQEFDVGKLTELMDAAKELS